MNSTLKKTLWSVGGTVAGAAVIGAGTMFFNMNDRLNQLESLSESKIQDRVSALEAKMEGNNRDITNQQRSNEAQWRTLNEQDLNRQQTEVDMKVIKTIQEKFVLPYMAYDAALHKHDEVKEKEKPTVGIIPAPLLPAPVPVPLAPKPKPKPKVGLDDVKKSLDNLKRPDTHRPYEKFRDEQIQQQQIIK